MELKEVAKRIQEIFKAEDIQQLKSSLFLCCLNNEFAKFDEYLELVGDFEQDWIQKTYQYFCSNREELKQDYTPKSMAKLVAELVYFPEAETVYDGCCGTGSLSLALWEKNPDLIFYMEEIDSNVIPFLLFNCCIRNMEAVIVNGDILKNKQYKKYVLHRGDKYSSVNAQDISSFIFPLTDIAVSNPPFSLSFKDELNPKYLKYGYTQKGSTESAFIINLLERTRSYGSCGIILPTGYITRQQTQDKNFRRYLIDNNLLDSCILCPGNFFESTATNTSILFIDKEKQHQEFVLIDATDICHQWVRRQNGFAHTANRVYEKTFNMFTDEDIGRILEYITERIYLRYDEKLKLLTQNDFDDNCFYAVGHYIKQDDVIDMTGSEEWRRLWEETVGHPLEVKTLHLKKGQSIQDALYDAGALLFANQGAKDRYLKNRFKYKED